MLLGSPDASEAEDDEEAEDRNGSGAPGGGQEAHHPLGHLRLRLGLLTLIFVVRIALTGPRCSTADTSFN